MAIAAESPEVQKYIEELEGKNQRLTSSIEKVKAEVNLDLEETTTSAFKGRNLSRYLTS
eukprot:SAG31_NODE_27780_length_420_cov_0.866044_2_plen_58_part_01